jgi:hypothetical protein
MGDFYNKKPKSNGEFDLGFWKTKKTGYALHISC